MGCVHEKHLRHLHVIPSINARTARRGEMEAARPFVNLTDGDASGGQNNSVDENNMKVQLVMTDVIGSAHFLILKYAAWKVLHRRIYKKWVALSCGNTFCVVTGVRGSLVG